MKPITYVCKSCDFSIKIDPECITSLRSLIKTIKENLITAELFGCAECTKELNDVLNSIRSDLRVKKAA